MPRKLFLLVPLLLAGCALGSSKYSCKGRPGSPLCRSVTEVYEKTHNRDALVKLEREKEEAPVPENTKTPAPAPLSPKPTVPVEDPLPIRTPAKVMRIWIAPWEDEDGDLIASGYVYTEIEPRRWQVGLEGKAVSASKVLEPLNAGSPTAPLLPAEDAFGRGQPENRPNPQTKGEKP